MKMPILLVLALTLGAGIATAQTPGNSKRPVGTGSADTRKIDENREKVIPAPETASPTNGTKNLHDNWRTSNGLNADPNNPNGAPGPSSGIGISPTR